MKVDVPDINIPRVVLVGGGFGGISVIKKLKDQEVQVVLIDKNNYHTFQPLLYQVATAGLEPDSIAYPLRKIFKRFNNFYFRMAEATEIVSAESLLKTSIGEIHYDYLVIATGSKTNYFGLENVEEMGMPMKSITEALDLRSLILQSFEESLLTSDLKKRESLMNFVVVGGGPTGVETAGALGELKKHILPKDYPELDIRRMQIHLIEAAPRLLPAMTEISSKKAEEFLKELSVNVWLETQVIDYDGVYVNTNNTDKTITASTLIWSAGVVGAGINGIEANSVTNDKRLVVDDFNKVKGYDNIFAIGDLANMESDEYPYGHPMLAPVAMQQGNLLARNILNLIKQKNLIKFKYNDQGSMATIGRNRAVVELPSIKFQGFFAWYVWMFVHLLSLVGFRNKSVVLINWIWNYFKYDKGIRLIIRPFERKSRD